MSPARPARFELRSETPMGALRLGIPAQAGQATAPDNLDAAIALGRCEPLLLALEAWLGCALDPAPVHPSMPEVPGLAATLHDDRLAPPGTCCRVPWAALRRGAPPAALQSAQVAWPSLPCQVELARYAEAPAHPSMLQPGRLLLLPQAFQPEWRVLLEDARNGLALEACLQAGEHGLRQPQAVAAQRPPAPWRVVLAQPLPVPTAFALGWQPATQLPLPPALQACLLGPDDATAWAEGRIVPALQGAALLIESTRSETPRTACMSQPHSLPA